MKVDINVLTPKSLTLKEEGRQLLQTLIDVSPLLVPQKHNTHESIPKAMIAIQTTILQCCAGDWC